MKTFNSLLLTALLLGSATSCASPIAASGHSVPVAANLIEQLIAALNSKDGAGLEQFLKEHASDAIPVADRLDRMKSLAEQGAPFKIVKLIPSRPGELKALVVDKGGMELGFKLTLTRDAEPTMDRLLAGPPDLLESAPAKSYANWASLQTLAKTIRSDAKSPALGIAMIRNGKLEQSVSGVREQGKNDKVTLDEPWNIGSIGKSLCSTVIGNLIESGKLKWDTTLGEVLGDLPMKDGYKAVTIEQIMHHRGGVPEDPGMRRPDVVRIVAGETDAIKIRQNYAKDILQRDLIAKPGQRFAYSNAGYALLGVIAEKVSGKQFEKLVKELIFDRLNLKHSYTSLDQLPTERPSGHVKNPEGLQSANFSGPLEILFAPAGGGMFMSLCDLAQFGQAHLDGLRGKDGFLKSATIKRLHQGVPEADPTGRQYACGWGIEAHPGIETMHMHNGSNGTMRAQLSIFPESNLVVASFINMGGETEPSPPLQAVLAVAGKYAKKS